MNSRIRNLGLAIIVLYVALFVQMNILQVGKADQLANDPRNNRQTIRDFSRMRGPIVTADGIAIAETVPAEAGDQFKFQRRYPTGDLFSNISGYYTFSFGSTQLEKTMNDVLMGDTDAQDVGAVTDLFRGENFGSVQLTLRHDVQQLAAQLLGNRTGSIVVMEPSTGRVLAAVSSPRYDPNQIAVHNRDRAGDVLDRLNADSRKPLLDRTYQERYMPGSSFKVLTTGISLDRSVTSMDREFPNETEFTPPQTNNPIQNFGGHACGGTMVQVFARSCNIPFAQMALELQPQGFVSGVELWGVGEKIPIDLPAPAAATVGLDANEFTKALPLLAIGGFGQGNDQVPPMFMAMVASTVANGGLMMKPYVVEATLAHDGTVLSRTQPAPWKRPISTVTASNLTTLMTAVVNSGTGKKMQLANGVQAAGKTGTAQLNDTGPERSNAWIIGFAPAQAPRYAIAVMLKGGPNDEVSASTGGTLCGPIAKKILDYLIAADGGR